MRTKTKPNLISSIKEAIRMKVRKKLSEASSTQGGGDTTKARKITQKSYDVAKADVIKKQHIVKKTLDTYNTAKEDLIQHTESEPTQYNKIQYQQIQHQHQIL